MQRVFDPRDPQLIASVATTRDARDASERLSMRREPEDSHSFREIRSIMSNRTGVCG